MPAFHLNENTTATMHIINIIRSEDNGIEAPEPGPASKGLPPPLTPSEPREVEVLLVVEVLDVPDDVLIVVAEAIEVDIELVEDWVEVLVPILLAAVVSPKELVLLNPVLVAPAEADELPPVAPGAIVPDAIVPDPALFVDLAEDAAVVAWLLACVLA